MVCEFPISQHHHIDTERIARRKIVRLLAWKTHVPDRAQKNGTPFPKSRPGVRGWLSTLAFDFVEHQLILFPFEAVDGGGVEIEFHHFDSVVESNAV